MEELEFTEGDESSIPPIVKQRGGNSSSRNTTNTRISYGSRIKPTLKENVGAARKKKTKNGGIDASSNISSSISGDSFGNLEKESCQSSIRSSISSQVSSGRRLKKRRLPFGSSKRYAVKKDDDDEVMSFVPSSQSQCQEELDDHSTSSNRSATKSSTSFRSSTRPNLKKQEPDKAHIRENTTRKEFRREVGTTPASLSSSVRFSLDTDSNSGPIVADTKSTVGTTVKTPSSNTGKASTLRSGKNSIDEEETKLSKSGSKAATVAKNARDSISSISSYATNESYALSLENVANVSSGGGGRRRKAGTGLSRRTRTRIPTSKTMDLSTSSRSLYDGTESGRFRQGKENEEKFKVNGKQKSSIDSLSQVGSSPPSPSIQPSLESLPIPTKNNDIGHSSTSISSGTINTMTRRKRLASKRAMYGSFNTHASSRREGNCDAEDLEENESDSLDESSFISFSKNKNIGERTSMMSGTMSSQLSVDTITGAGTDVLAVQDAGSYQFLYDDCLYLCSTLMSCQGEEDDSTCARDKLKQQAHERKWNDDTMMAGQRGLVRHTSITADAACDLAITLSSKKTRSVLLSLGGVGDGREKKGDDVSKSSALEFVLDALSCVPQTDGISPLPSTMVFREEDEGQAENNFDDWKEVKGCDTRVSREHDENIFSGFVRSESAKSRSSVGGVSSRTKSARMKIGGGEASLDLDTDGVLSNQILIQTESNLRPETSDMPRNVFPIPLTNYDLVSVEALAIVSHYISLDCTKSTKFSASNSPATARGVRRTILRHKNALCGIAKLILADPLVSNILRTQTLNSGLNGSTKGASLMQTSQTARNVNVKDVSYQFNESPEENTPLSQDSLDMKFSQDSMQIFSQDSFCSMVSVARKRPSEQEDGSQSSLAAAGDPTKMGRRSKKRRRLVQKHTEMIDLPASGLESIPEEDKIKEKKDINEESSKYNQPSSKMKTCSNYTAPADCSPGASSVRMNAGKEDASRQTQKSGRLDFVSDEGSNSNRLRQFIKKREMEDPWSQSGVESVKSYHQRRLNISLKFRRKIDKASSRIIQSFNDSIDCEIPISVGKDFDDNSVCNSGCIYCQNGVVNIDTQRNEKQRGKSPSANRLNPGLLAIKAMNRILTGKDDCDEVNEEPEDEDVDEEMVEDSDKILQKSEIEESQVQISEKDSIEMNNLSNPLMFKNVMLRRSGALPHLARAMAETMEAVVFLVLNEDKEVTDLPSYNDVDDDVKKQRYIKCCKDCLLYLQQRVHALSSIIDGACCLSDQNRNILCKVGHKSEDGFTAEDGMLVSSLIRLVTNVAINFSSVESCNETSENIVLSDISLTAFRTLTSLTHENESAGRQMLVKYNMKKQTFLHEFHDGMFGVAIIVNLLHNLVSVQRKMKDALSKVQSKLKRVRRIELDKLLHNCYDAILFCLNILANILETSSSTAAKEIILEMKILVDKNHNKKREEEQNLALSWLARWVVSQTATYRDAVMMGSFGGNNINLIKDKRSRDLEKHEDEYLVTAGNGFILLACLMRDGMTHSGEDFKSNKEKAITLNIRKIILSEMPKDDEGGSTGTTLIIKTLKAFCNFYHFSVGDLSVAVVNPVLKLVTELEKM